MIHYSIVKITLPVITGTCKAQGNPSTGTPLTCVDDGAGPVSDRVYKFTNYMGNIPESGIFKQISSISETTPELKGGSDVASRASISITFSDFIDDPNLDSEALLDNPELRRTGTFFGKLNERQIINNKTIEHEYWKTDGFTHTLVKTHTYYGATFKKTGDMKWTITGEDILSRIQESKRSFPNELYETIVNASGITETTTSIEITKNEVTAYQWGLSNIGIIGSDIIVITNRVDNGSTITLTVERQTTVRIGDGGNSITIPLPAGAKVREITNVPQSAKKGDSIFLAKVYGNTYDSNGDIIPSTLVGPLPRSNPARLIDDILSDVGFSGKVSDFTDIDEYLPNSEMYTIYYNPESALKEIKEVSRTYLLDVFSDLESDEVAITSTSPWIAPQRQLLEGRDFDYLSDRVEKSEDLRYSRTTLYYSKQQLTESSEKTSFKRVSLSKDTTLESDDFYSEVKIKELGETKILGNTDRDVELADTATIRHTRRFGLRPEKIKMVMSEAQLANTRTSDVVEIKGKGTIDEFGKQSFKSFQITRVQPKFDIARTYHVTAISYRPDSTGIGNSTIYVNQTENLNLYLLAGSPPAVITRTFVFDGQVISQSTSPYAVNVGTFVTGSTINIVLLNGATLTARGGYGGDGGFALNGGVNGGDGGIVLFGASGVEVNVYMDGTDTIDGNPYTFEGNIWAPGGGGGGGGGYFISSPRTQQTGAGGGGGAGGAVGNGGQSRRDDNSANDGQPGSLTDGGLAGDAGATNAGDGGKGGNLGEDGDDGDTGNSSGGLGGNAGKAISVNSGTFKLYGAVSGVNYIVGNGDTGASVQLLPAPT